MSENCPQQDSIEMTRRAALAAGTLAVSGGMLAATKGLAASPEQVQMVPATIVAKHSDEVAEVVPLRTKVTLETDASASKHSVLGDEPADFRGHRRGTPCS